MSKATYNRRNPISALAHTCQGVKEGDAMYLPGPKRMCKLSASDICILWRQERHPPIRKQLCVFGLRRSALLGSQCMLHCRSERCDGHSSSTEAGRVRSLIHLLVFVNNLV